MGIFNRRSSNDDPQPDTDPPAEPSKSAQSVGFETVLGASSKLEGELTSEGNVRLDGEFKGTLNITGNVLVGEDADIHADIDARNISIAGSVRGNVIGNKVQLLRTGRIWGDINARALTTEEGAFIDGKITMGGHDAADTTATVSGTVDDETQLPSSDNASDDADAMTGDSEASDDAETANDDDASTSDNDNDDDDE